MITITSRPMNAYRKAVLLLSAVACAAIPAKAMAQTVIFRQPGFPAIDSEEISSTTLSAALGKSSTFLDVDQLRAGDWANGTKLLVLPYGSAFPVEAWPAVQSYLHKGGNLLLLGGQPLRVPVLGHAKGSFVAESPQDSYSKTIDFRHSYEVPLDGAKTHFEWRSGYTFMPKTGVRIAKIFAEEGRLQGLGYLDAEDGTHLAAPVIYADHGVGSNMAGSRIVALPFTPDAGYWASEDGIRLIHAAAQYALEGATSFQIELQYACLRPGERPQITLHIRRPHQAAVAGFADVKLLREEKVLDQAHIAISANQNDAAVTFNAPLPAGNYTVRATLSSSGADAPQEFAQNGFQIEDLAELEMGDALGVNGDFLTLGGKPFFPVGTNYFTTEENGWDFLRTAQRSCLGERLCGHAAPRCELRPNRRLDGRRQVCRAGNWRSERTFPA